jgi:hypothetical protein
MSDICANEIVYKVETGYVRLSRGLLHSVVWCLFLIAFLSTLASLFTAKSSTLVVLAWGLTSLFPLGRWFEVNKQYGNGYGSFVV